LIFCETTHGAVATAAAFSSADLIAETNPEGTRSANEIPIGPHDFEFANGVTDLDRADLRSGERNHFSEVTSSDEFNRRRAKYRTKRAIKCSR
jgi:hypothetical protein